MVLPIPLEYLLGRTHIEAGGDQTELIFDNLATNPELSDSAFELTLPDDIQIKNVSLRGRNE